MIRWKRSWPELSEELPVDVMPASNGEFVPPPPTREQVAAMEIANREVERVRRRMGMSRRDFVRSAAAYTIGFWALNQVNGGRWGRYAVADGTDTTDACDLEWSAASGIESLNNMEGEFIFDVQSHHVESDGMWRVTNPGFEAFFAAVWSQAGPLGDRPTVREDGSIRGFGGGEIDPIENLSRFHYLKEMFLDSATTMTVLSAVPAAPDITQPLPIDRAVLTAETVNNLAGSQRTVLHAFVMPNRGSAGTVASTFGQEPVYMRREFEIMEERAAQWGGLIRGWKTYPAWGDIPYASGWFFDDELVGQRFIDHVRYVGNKYGVPKNIATHKGFALPAFDQRAASPRDIGPAASRNPDVNFIVYHSGFDGEPMTAYPGDDKVNSADRTVDSFIKSLRENNWDATRFAGSSGFGNVPNVYAEIGSTWRSNMGNPNSAAHLLGKLIRYVGPKRICWGTDALWFGSPHSEIIGLRRLVFSNEMNQLYGLAAGLDSDVEDPTQLAPNPKRTIRNWIFGRAAAEVYGVDADAHLNDRATNPIACDEVQKIRDGYILNQMTPKEHVPLASNSIVGPRNAQELFKLREGPWAP
ncbi:MAG TPA: hypothetical protein VGB83_06365 [Actinomycetota bacterium]